MCSILQMRKLRLWEAVTCLRADSQGRQDSPRYDCEPLAPSMLLHYLRGWMGRHRRELVMCRVRSYERMMRIRMYLKKWWGCWWSCWVKLLRSRNGGSWPQGNSTWLASQSHVLCVAFHCLEQRWLNISCIQLTFLGNANSLFENSLQATF